MGQIADEMGRLAITAYSPDKNVKGMLRGDDMLVLFRDDAYEQYTERDLEPQLEHIANEVCRAYWRAFLGIAKRAGSTVYRKPEDTWDKPTRQFLKLRPTIESHAASSDGSVQTSAVGMRNWQIRIKPGTLAERTETEFVTRLLTAAALLRRDYTATCVRLQGELEHPGVANTVP